MTTPGDLDDRFRAAVAAFAALAAEPDDTTPGAAAETGRPAADRPVREDSLLTGDRAIALFEAQIASRHLDLAARWLRSFNEGYYTIGSSGHEGNAAVAAALAPTDPALLHYRSGAFYVTRSTMTAANGDVEAMRSLSHRPTTF